MLEDSIPITEAEDVKFEDKRYIVAFNNIYVCMLKH